MPQTSQQAESRTEEATPLRLDEARRSGFVPRSGDVTNVAVLLTAGGMIAWLGPMLLDGVQTMTASLLDGRSEPLANPAVLSKTFTKALPGVLLPVAGILGACVVAAVLAGLVQFKPLTTFEPVRPQWSRLSVSAGLKRMFSLRGGVRTALALAKLAVLAWLGADVVRSGIAGFLAVTQSDAEHLAADVAGLVRGTLVPLVAALLVLAVVDWLFQRRQYRRDLRMSRQEWKEDFKRMEGDGTIRTARRKARRNRHAASTKGQTA
jgi:flagellar biosynthetic protein FlhB